MSRGRNSTPRRGWGWQGWTLSIGVHGLLLAGLLWGEPPPRPSSTDRSPVKVSLVTRRAPPAPAVQAPTVAPEPDEEAKVRRARPKKQRVVKAKAKVKAPTRAKAPQQEQAAQPQQEQPATPAPPRFAVSLEATIPGGGVALPAVSGGSGSAFAAPRSDGETRRGGRGQSGGSSASAPGRGAERRSRRDHAAPAVSASPRTSSCRRPTPRPRVSRGWRATCSSRSSSPPAARSPR